MLETNEYYQTKTQHFYAASDVVGFPSLVLTGMAQGRHSALHAFGGVVTNFPQLLPYGIYSIPEISVVGKSEIELTEAAIAYEVGKAICRETARG